ncbi:MAG: helix-turn-helix transcriptional regulator [Saprospiraceae bacterium]|nr:helix-turn-helix transcriptional regulator [Saprospiraceae bacterium]
MSESPIHLILITLIYFCLLVALAQFTATKHRTILYYTGYLCGLAMHYTRDFFVNYAPGSWRMHVPDLPLRWDSPTSLMAHSFYFVFIDAVFCLKRNSQRLHFIFITFTWIFIALAVIHIGLQIFSGYAAAQIMYHWARIFYLPLFIFMVVRLFFLPALLFHQRMILIGSLILIISYFPTMLRRWLPVKQQIPDILYCIQTDFGNICLPPIRVGIILEILCFSWAMAFFVRRNFTTESSSNFSTTPPPEHDSQPEAKMAVFPSEHPFAKAIEDYIESRLSDESLGVPDVCKFIALSNSQVTRKLKDICGLSTEQFIQRYRMHRAFEMLQAGNMRVGEVATAVGFKEVAYFSRVFKQTYGVSPREVRKDNDAV